LVTCNWCEARLAPFVDGDLTPRIRAAVVAHVDRCASCAGLLEELRVIDALLLEPREMRLAPNFTFATMAELRDLPPPSRPCTPIRAFTVSYLVACWLLVIAATILSPQPLRAAGETLAGVARTMVEALGGVGHVAARLTGRAEISSWPLVLGWIVAMQAMLMGAAFTLLRHARPSIIERLRS
jgi:hypothetical protein